MGHVFLSVNFFRRCKTRPLQPPLLFVLTFLGSFLANFSFSFFFFGPFLIISFLFLCQFSDFNLLLSFCVLLLMPFSALPSNTSILSPSLSLSPSQSLTYFTFLLSFPSLWGRTLILFVFVSPSLGI